MVSASWPISWVLFLTADQVQTVRSFDITRRNGFVTHSKQFGRLMQLFNDLETKQLVSLSEVPTQVTWNLNPIPKDSIDIANIMRLLSMGVDSVVNAPVLTIPVGSGR